MISAASVLTQGACSSDEESAAPSGVACSSTTTAGSAAEARAALATAASGTCVVLTAGSYDAPLDVPAGVRLVGRDGQRPSVVGAGEAEAAISLGEGAELIGVAVSAPANVGVAIRAASATVRDVTVTGAKSAALAIRCDGDSCSGGTVSVVNVMLEKSLLGLWVSGAHVRMNGGRSAEHTSMSITSAAGVMAVEGANVELEDVTVEQNDGIGVLVDGERTQASLEAVTVADNHDRGVWIQRVAGTLDAPAVRIENSNLVRNRVVGVGGVEARGIIVVGGKVAETIAAPIPTDLSTNESVGDGIGILAGSTDIRIDGSLIEANERAAGIIDGSDRGIIVVGGRVSAGASGLKFVVQNSDGASLDLPDGDRSVVGKKLGVSAQKIKIPSVL